MTKGKKKAPQNFLSPGHTIISSIPVNIKDYTTKKDCFILITIHGGVCSVKAMNRSLIEINETVSWSSTYQQMPPEMFLTPKGYHIEISGGNGNEWLVSSVIDDFS